MGGPEVLKYKDLPDPSPAPGQMPIDIQAVGVNFTDVNTRLGVNSPVSLPITLGIEAAGVISAIGDGVTDLEAGDTVAYWSVMGYYTERAAIAADKMVKMPDGMDARTGAAALLQGMTAHYLAYSTYPLKSPVTRAWSIRGPVEPGCC